MLLMPVLLVQALSSCSLIDEPETISGDLNVKASLAFTVSSDKKNSTRMADDVAQETGFRGLDIVSMIPFAINGEDFVNHGQKIVNTDEPSLLLDDASRVNETKNTYYFYQSYTMVRGVNAFLVYGRAGKTNMSAPTGVPEEAYFGSLRFMSKEETSMQQLSDLTTPDLRKLRFTLDPIYPSSTVPAEAPADAELLAGYLSYIAQTPGWSVTNPSYMFFTGLNDEGHMVMAGSSANVVAHVNALYNMIKSENEALKNAIRDRIQNPEQSEQNLNINLTSTGSGDSWKLTAIQKKADGNSYENIEYPSSVGLPDGAAALRWVVSENKFVPQTMTTPLDNINNIGRFCYPAELFYYANSRINTSNWIIGPAVYYADNWDDVCSQYQYQPGTVTNSTKAVAICDPLQYAVGRLKISLKAETTPLKDSNGDNVPLEATSFPLTGVIVCNQHPVDFNFKPVLEASGASSHDDDSFIYDTQVKNGSDYYCLSTTEQNIPSTLVLQTYDTGEGNDKKGAEEVTIVMEFQNDSGQSFSGKDCVIYPGTKFYLIGKIKPSETTSSNEPAEAKGRVFTQDYVTTINTKVQSLDNAYNVLPDLIGGRLELGVELVSSWVQAETTNVILK